LDTLPKLVKSLSGIYDGRGGVGAKATRAMALGVGRKSLIPPICPVHNPTNIYLSSTQPNKYLVFASPNCFVAQQSLSIFSLHRLRSRKFPCQPTAPSRAASRCSPRPSCLTGRSTSGRRPDRAEGGHLQISHTHSTPPVW
jgi:hypothetical protein